MWDRKEIVTLPPSYIQVPGSTYLILSVVIHQGVEIVVIGVSPIVSVSSVRLGKGVDWAVIDHMSQGVASPADPKIADVIRVSPLRTEITLDHQTMMCSMSWCQFSQVGQMCMGQKSP